MWKRRKDLGALPMGVQCLNFTNHIQSAIDVQNISMANAKRGNGWWREKEKKLKH